jgi:hypothetical protein
MNPHYPLVSSRARHACEYCRAPEIVFNFPFEVEHIMPRARGGETSENNLALSCRSCNLYKSNHLSGVDEETGQDSALFNPRRDMWREHFAIDAETEEVNGLTARGRVKVARLRMNNGAQVEARKMWLRLGLLSRDLN